MHVFYLYFLSFCLQFGDYNLTDTYDNSITKNIRFLGDILYNPNDNQDTGEKLNGTRIQAFFIKKMYHYCKLILKWDDCGLYELSGCGLNSDCPPNTRLMYSFLLFFSCPI